MSLMALGGIDEEEADDGGDDDDDDEDDDDEDEDDTPSSTGAIFTADADVANSEAIAMDKDKGVDDGGLSSSAYTTETLLIVGVLVGVLPCGVLLDEVSVDDIFPLSWSEEVLFVVFLVMVLLVVVLVVVSEEPLVVVR